MTPYLILVHVVLLATCVHGLRCCLPASEHISHRRSWDYQDLLARRSA